MSDPNGDGPKAARLRDRLRLDRALRLVWTSAPGLATTNLGLTIVEGLLPLAGLYAVKRMIDALTEGVAAGAGPGGFRQVLIWIGAAVGIALLNALVHALQELVGQAQSLVMSDKVADILHAKSVEVDLGYYEDSRYHNTLHRAQGDAVGRPANIVGRLVTVGRSSVMLVGITALLVALNPLLAVVLALVAIPGAIVKVVYARKLYRFERERTETERRAWYYHFLLTHSTNAAEVRLFDLGALFRGRHRGLRHGLRLARLALARRRSIASLLAQTAVTLAVFGCLTFIAGRAWQGIITVGSLVMYYAAFQQAAGAIGSLLAGLAGLYEDNLFLANFYEFLDLKPGIAAPARPATVPRRLVKGISFSDVVFAYPGSARRVLDGVSLTLAPNRVTALIGKNGSGKTTLIRLLCRLYDPESGRIKVDGVDLREMDPVKWRQSISVILQDYVRYQLPVWENIWLGDWQGGEGGQREKEDGAAVRSRIIAAAVRSGADPMIRRLPKGYDTPLGRWFEDGRELSVGEWQKIAIARALLRNSQLVVLDEPFSALDALAEMELLKDLRQALQGRSAVLISHRLATVRLADYSYVLDQGRVIEQGTHQELLNLDGLYSRLAGSPG